MTSPLFRHPELVSGSIARHARSNWASANRAVDWSNASSGQSARWMLKQVQHDEFGLERA